MSELPNSIRLKNSIPSSVTFHPSLNQIAVGLLDGDVACYKYEGPIVKRLFLSKHHKDSVRCVKYHPQGSLLFTCSLDNSIQALDTSTHQVVLKKSKAHIAPVNTLTPLSEHTVASGCEEGTIRIWDLRQRHVVLEYQEHEDTVTEIVQKGQELISIGEDGYVTCFNLKKKALVARSDPMEEGLTCLQYIGEHQQKLVIAQTDGVMGIWKHGWWGDLVDRIVGHEDSINAMVQLEPRKLVTACSDGKLRIVNVAPNKIETVISNTGFISVDGLSISHDKRLVASYSYDENIVLWDTSPWIQPPKTSESESESELSSDELEE